jgi:transposase-like protein
MEKPKTLQAATKHFADEQVCIDTVARLSWSDGKPTCPACGHQDHYWLDKQRRWKCKECWKQFSVKVGTIFEDSPLSLDKWLIALWMLVNCRNGVSSYEVGRSLGVSQKSGWFMLHRLRYALQNGSITKLGGNGAPVEVDETFIGGKARFMHRTKRERMSKDGGMQGGAGKTVVMGMLERGGKVQNRCTRASPTEWS